MLKNLTNLAATIATLALASLGQAGVVGVATPLVPPGNFVGPWFGLNGGDWTSYQIDVMTDDGSLINAVDAHITGTFHQSWGDPNYDDILDPSVTGPIGIPTGDSCLTPIVLSPIGAAFFEDNNGRNGPGGSPLVDTICPGCFSGGQMDHGIGTFLTGAWGIPASDQADSTNIARIVIPAGSESSVEFFINVSTSNGTFQVDGSSILPVPESATIVLAAMGIIGCLSRRQ